MNEPLPEMVTHKIRLAPASFDDGYLEQLDQSCWNCHAQVGERPVVHRILYRRGARVLIENWHHCRCGAYQNVLRWGVYEISPRKRAR